CTTTFTTQPSQRRKSTSAHLLPLSHSPGVARNSPDWKATMHCEPIEPDGESSYELGEELADIEIDPVLADLLQQPTQAAELYRSRMSSSDIGRRMMRDLAPDVEAAEVTTLQRVTELCDRTRDDDPVVAAAAQLAIGRIAYRASSGSARSLGDV